MQNWADDHEAFLDAKLAGLKAGLRLTPDQEKLWPPFETAVRDAAKLHMDQMKSMMDRMQKMREMMRSMNNSEDMTGTGGRWPDDLPDRPTGSHGAADDRARRRDQEGR